MTDPSRPGPELRPGFPVDFHELYTEDGLARLDALWQAFVRDLDPALADRLQTARADPDALPSRAESALLIQTGPLLDAFLARLFGIEAEHGALHAAHRSLEPLFRVKWKFVRRQAVLGVPLESLRDFDAAAARASLLERLPAEDANAARSATPDDPAAAMDELRLARAILTWQSDPQTHAADLDLARRYCAWAAATPQGRAWHADSVLFRLPEPIDPLDRLPPVQRVEEGGVQRIRIVPASRRRRLDGSRAPFALTDPGVGLRGALDEARYCLLCHEQGKDSCSSGLREEGAADAPLRRSVFGEALAGCPLGERISEFQALKREGWSIAALAMIVIDNPMVAATGHRICNDCMKACVYQHQSPVDIPQAETRTLRDVLELPWGFEVYSLLTRWNPLNLRRPLPRPDSGRKVLVVGLGPAGFTLAHHLLNDGHTVLGIDGLKIEPLAPGLGGRAPDGGAVQFEPVHRVADLIEPLQDRTPAGFGGVAEYGITARWDKNFLRLVRLLLERRSRFALAGGVRFGGTLTVEDAWSQGFDHIALAMGAGRPATLDLPNGLARGVRTASDFLMALQLTGAARADSLANLHLRLPAIVIGGGLTAIDTATEALAYYVAQTARFLERHEALVRTVGEEAAQQGWSAEDHELAQEWLQHGRALRAERELAQRDQRTARLNELLDAWGGVTVVCRRRLIDSPAYTLNPEEVGKALQEGIRIAECLAPQRLEVDEWGAVRSITLRPRLRDAEGRWRDAPAQDAVTWPARTVLIAAGTRPNTQLADEDPAHARRDGAFFQALDETGVPVAAEQVRHSKDAPTVLLHRSADARWLSFFGDLHPAFAGNVVKAMASAARGWPVISRVLSRREPASPTPSADFLRGQLDRLQPRVESVEQLAPGIVELVIRAPAAARHFEAGQFYRLQNLETRAVRQEGPGGLPTRLAMEGLALTGAGVDRQNGRVSTIVLEMGGSSDLCRRLVPGEPVVLMGPTGTPTEIPRNQTVILVGGGLGNAVLFSIGAALRAAGSRVLYFAGYRRRQDRFKVAEIEAAADWVVWCCDELPGFVPTRAQDRAFDGNLVQALLAWARGMPLRDASGRADDGRRPLELSQADRLLTIGSDRMMAAVARARQGELAPYLKRDQVAIGSINSPMQCMLKGLCGQCLQPQIDPASGQTRLVFSCEQQDQPLDCVDFAALDQRLRQNALQERQTARWLGQIADRPPVA